MRLASPTRTHILSNTRKVDQGLDVVLRQDLRVADTGQLEQLRGLDSS